MSSSSTRHPSSTRPIHIIQGTRFRAIFLELGATSHTFSNEGHRENNPRQRPGFAPVWGWFGDGFEGPKPCYTGSNPSIGGSSDP